jgi:hypothetical protein
LAAKSKVICDNVLPITLYKGTDDVKPNTACYRTVEKLNLAHCRNRAALVSQGSGSTQQPSSG